MALVRVYCGLGSAPPAATRSSAAAWLTAAVVDDAGRLIDVCDISDDPVGYAELGALLAERSGGTAGIAVAADSADHQVTLLLAAAGRPLAIAEEELLDSYAEQFGDDESFEEVQAPSGERRAVGLARALQAGALAASTHGAPRELMALRPVLAAHAALATGRQGAAMALREVLRELYPAALRAYPDPAEPVPLAILDALPEPGLLAGPGTRGRENAVASSLADAGVVDLQTVTDAIASLRIAIGETPRRAGIGKTLTAAVAETVQHAVAAVRACDSGVTALVGLLAEKATPIPSTARPPVPAARPAPAPSAPLRAIRPESGEPLPREPLPREPLPREPVLPTRREPAAAPPERVAPAAALPPTARPGFSYPTAPGAAAALSSARAAAIPTPRAAAEPRRGSEPPRTAQPSRINEPPRINEPLRAPEPPRMPERPRMPESRRLAPDIPPPGSRSDWPLNTSAPSFSDQATFTDPVAVSDTANYPPVREPEPAPEPQRNSRVTPPWQADDLPTEPPTLRLVEPAPVAPAGDYGRDPLAGTPALRLVGGDPGTTALDRPISPPPNDAGDGDLLIFAQASAWFTGHVEDTEPAELNWDNPADLGWRAAERATSPILGEETTAGLPRRVPQANLVPGSPLPPAEDQPLRIVRDPAAMAQHTTGYFRGSRRGEEVRGFALGGRPGRETAGGWDFSREGWEDDDNPDRGYEYHSAARR